MSQFFRVRLAHRSHYAGFKVCAFHAIQYRDNAAVEIVEIDPKTLTPVHVGLSHCEACNRSKDAPVPVPVRVAIG